MKAVSDQNSNTDTCQPFMVKGYVYVDRLRNDTNFIQKSFLNNFIYFGSESDPLFLTPYKVLINSENSFMEKHPCVVALFTLKFDLAFRLNQAQKTLIAESIAVMCPPIKTVQGSIRDMEQ
jgi:hypothetical protein